MSDTCLLPRQPVIPSAPGRPSNLPRDRAAMRAPRRLLSIGHSYVVAGNRRLAHAIHHAAEGRWEVVAAAPTYFHGQRDLRPTVLDTAPTSRSRSSRCAPT